MLHAHKVNAMLEPRYIQRHGMIAGREALVQYLFNFPAQAILERHRYLPFPGPFLQTFLILSMMFRIFSLVTIRTTYN